MHRGTATQRSSRLSSRRSGVLLRGLGVGVSAVAVASLAGWWLLPRLSWSRSEEAPILHEVTRADFFHDVTARGNVESASNVEIRCEVQSMKSAGTMILEVVPEGTYVNEGDLLVRLDSSWLEAERTQQQITCATSEATVTEAENAYETAKIALQEYIEGEYVLERQNYESERLVAQEDFSRAEENFDYSEKLEAKGYITGLQLKAEEFAVKQAKMDLKSAELKLHVLEKFTKPKKEKELASAIVTAKAKLDAKKHSHELDVKELRRIEEQIAKCEIRAPEAGQVVYANVTNRRGGSEIIIEPGTLVREHQVIIRLPDPKRMQVSAKINESRISSIEEGMTATIRLDAFPEMELSGTVEEVGDYPAPTSWFRGDIKEYETIIKIDNPPPGLKPGLTAQVKIRVHELGGAMQVPVQAVIEQGMRHYCVLREGERWKAREIHAGWSNDKFVVVCDLVALPVPAVFRFDGRPFCLVRRGERWQAREVKIVSVAGKTARLEGAPGGVGEAPWVFEHEGEQVELLFDGRQWSVGPVKKNAKTGRLEPVAGSVRPPVQAVFDSDGALYCLECDYQQWAEIQDAAPGDGSPPATPNAPPDQGSGPGADEAETEKPQGDAAEGPPKKPPGPPAGEQDAETPALGPRTQQFDARKVRRDPAPGDRESIGIGLVPGEEVVLHADAFRDKVWLPEPADEEPARRKPRQSARPKAARKPDGKKAKPGSPLEAFKALDGDKDGKVQKSELEGHRLGAVLKSRFGQIDADGDGAIDRAEWLKASAEFRQKTRDAKPRPGGRP